MGGLGFWWFSSDLKERVMTLTAMTLLACFVMGMSVTTRTIPAMSCAEAIAARRAAVETLNGAKDGDGEAKCEGYRQMAALLVRYKTDWRWCAPMSGRSADADMDAQGRFYQKIVRTCG